MPEPGLAQSTLRIAAYNIRHGRGMDGEVDLARIADVLRALDADVITLQEVDNRTERTGRVDQTAVLAEEESERGRDEKKAGNARHSAIQVALCVGRSWCFGVFRVRSRLEAQECAGYQNHERHTCQPPLLEIDAGQRHDGTHREHTHLPLEHVTGFGRPVEEERHADLSRPISRGSV